MSREDEMLLEHQGFWGIYFPRKLRLKYNGLTEVVVDQQDIATAGDVMPTGYFPPGLIYCQARRRPVGVYRWNGECYVLQNAFLPRRLKR